MTMLGTFGGGVMGFLIGPLGLAGIYFIMIVLILLGGNRHHLWGKRV